MSKIVCEYDSVEKSMKLTVDGKTMENVDSFICSLGWDDDGDYRCEITQCLEDEENFVKTHTRTMASDSKHGKEAISEGFPEDTHLKGFVTKPDFHSGVADIIKYFKNTR